MANLLIPPQLQFVSHDGAPYAGGRLFTFVPSTSDGKAAWRDSAETIVWTNPIILDDRGAAQVYGSGDYRLILEDSDGNQIFDTLSSEPLAADVISAIMLPVVGASSLLQARDLMGVTAAIAAAAAAVSLVPGPAGVAGPKGDKGDKGDTGAAGGSGSSSTTEYHGGNPAWFRDNNSGFIVQMGSGATDSTGMVTMTYGTPYNNVVAVIAQTAGDTNIPWSNVSGITNTNFNVQTISPSFGGSWVGGPASFWWVAFGN